MASTRADISFLSVSGDLRLHAQVQGPVKARDLGGYGRAPSEPEGGDLGQSGPRPMLDEAAEVAAIDAFLSR